MEEDKKIKKTAMTIYLEEEDLALLGQMGLSNSQLKMYIALLKLEKADVKTLANRADLPRQAAYRTLDELQAKGIVEKIFDSPVKYEAIPLPEILSIVVNLKRNEYHRTLQRTEAYALALTLQGIRVQGKI